MRSKFQKLPLGEDCVKYMKKTPKAPADIDKWVMDPPSIIPSAATLSPSTTLLASTSLSASFLLSSSLTSGILASPIKLPDEIPAGDQDTAATSSLSATFPTSAIPLVSSVLSSIISSMLEPGPDEQPYLSIKTLAGNQETTATPSDSYSSVVVSSYCAEAPAASKSPFLGSTMIFGTTSFASMGLSPSALQMLGGGQIPSTSSVMDDVVLPQSVSEASSTIATSVVVDEVLVLVTMEVSNPSSSIIDTTFSETNQGLPQAGTNRNFAIYLAIFCSLLLTFGFILAYRRIRRFLIRTSDSLSRLSKFGRDQIRRKTAAILAILLTMGLLNWLCFIVVQFRKETALITPWSAAEAFLEICKTGKVPSKLIFLSFSETRLTSTRKLAIPSATIARSI